MKRIRSLLILLVVGVCFYSVPAQAVIITWDFSSSPQAGNLGISTKDYTSGGFTITASGFNTSNSAVSPWILAGVTTHNLFEKFVVSDPSEQGLGLTGTSLGANEIQDQTLVQLNLTNLKNAGFTDLTLSIGSVQSPEAFSIFGSDAAAADGVSGTLLTSGTGTDLDVSNFIADRSFPGLIPYNFFWFTATAVDVLLLNGLAATQAEVPEPATMLLLGSGLLGMGVFARRRFKR